MRKYLQRLVNRTQNCKTGLESKFCVVQGLQWGQEGKNKLLNRLAPDYDYSCRFNGGLSSEPSKCVLVHSKLIHLVVIVETAVMVILV